jgi:hypothetical protein
MTASAQASRTPDQRLVTLALFLVVLVSVVLVAVLNPGLVRFWPMSSGEFVQTIAPLFLVSLFIERVLEVFLTTWRGPDAAAQAQKVKKAKDAAKHAHAASEAAHLISHLQAEAGKEEDTLVDYKAKTQRVAFLSGIALGVVVSALGVRALGLFVDPAVFADLRHVHPVQAQWFNAADVFLTGAVLGGGSDGLHKLVSVFTDFLDTTSARAKAARPAA